ncbi:bifunctional hydroxymethylpyrimidine kinase/phosphomethylpyrimidine kinase [Enterovirga sp.]|uniref:bifunctional hydroxymethylpyrimidine kinase/phosphomethylpyrimidine kinase n=1 Tax=Enterovirga sp. TaxID=2026350 RepID=UPI0026022F66|nr:bifunctional hydroxymethylpyrimidine kinase/phosphomethylpyrimidine kinase [Enterovirga sp.]MDB5591757.1 bifunctional hydroxymethylpyrimidine kinase/phosphomethylpyrimidine kinase [Enterovirga sp.]
MTPQDRTPVALTIAGSDSGGGAGIQADLKTFSARGVYGASVLTALTAQNTTGVQGVLDVPAAFVRQQMDSVFGDLGVAAVKIGMLSRPETIEAVASGLERYRARNVVLDPVMVATSGDRLISPEAVAVLRRLLLPLSDLVTPNLPEAAALLGDAAVPESEAEMEAAGRRLLAVGARAVLLKGGHGHGPDSVDLLVTPGGTERFAAPRLRTVNTHGTGCTLSAAIAAHLALGRPMRDAVSGAKTYLTSALEAADRLKIGRGSGPVHHFHAWWQPPSP